LWSDPRTESGPSSFGQLGLNRLSILVINEDLNSALRLARDQRTTPQPAGVILVANHKLERGSRLGATREEMKGWEDRQDQGTTGCPGIV